MSIQTPSIEDKELDQTLFAFVSSYNAAVDKHPRLLLDHSWPSIGIIDLLSFPLRYRLELTPELERLKKSVSVYIASFICETWRSLGLEVRVLKEPSLGVSIALTRNEEELIVPVEDILGSLLQSLPNPLSVYDSLERPVTHDSRFLSVVCLGMLMGKLPGVPTKFSDTEIRELEKELAKQSSRWFQRVSPESPYTHVPEQFLKKIILPPVFLEDEAPFVSTVTELISYWRNMGATGQTIIDVMREYCLCPDEQISLVGCCFTACFKNITSIPAEFIAAARSQPKMIPFLRPALNAVRLEFSPSSEWLLPGCLINSKEMLEIEEEIGSLPWLYMSFSKIEGSSSPNDPLHPVLEAIFSFEYEVAYRKLTQLIDEDTSDIELRLQEIKLDSVRGDFEAAHARCKNLISEPEVESNPRFYNLWGSILLQLDEPEVAKRYFKAAASVSHVSPSLKAEVLNNLAWCHILSESFESAERLLLEARSLSPCPVTISLNLAHVADVLGKEKERDIYLEYPSQVAPFDRRVFANLVKNFTP